jgi:hypothetical protein
LSSREPATRCTRTTSTPDQLVALPSYLVLEIYDKYLITLWG